MKTVFNKTPVLVTGATGFIGSHLVKALLKKNARVIIITRPASSLWRLKKIINQVQILKADLTQRRLLHQLLRETNPKMVFHLAANIDHSRSIRLIRDTLRDNILGSLNLIEWFLAHPPHVFINFGTCEEYGDSIMPFDENMREKPVSPYSVTKTAITHYCGMFYRIHKFPVVTVRPFLTYGPFQTSSSLIPYCIRQALKSLPINVTKGEQTREFNYISDMVEGILLAATTKKAIGEIINLGTGKEYKVKNVIKLILTLTGSHSRVNIGALAYKPGEAMRFYCRSDKVKKLLGWKPKVTLEQGLKKTIEWQKHYFL